MTHELPSFLKIENKIEPDKKTLEFKETLKKYEDMFGDRISNEGLTFTLEELTGIMKVCIEENKPYEELTGDILKKDELI